MARVGSWDITGYATTWSDINADISGWIDRDYIPFEVTPTPPPPPPKPPPKFVSGGAPPFSYPEPEPCVVVPVPLPEDTPQPDTVIPYREEDTAIVCPTAEPQADYAVFPLGDDAPVKALESGVLEASVSRTGEPVLLLLGESGTRYLYTNVGRFDAAGGRRVERGETIGRTRPHSLEEQSMRNTHVVRGLLGEAPPEYATLPASQSAPEVDPSTPPVQVQESAESLEARIARAQALDAALLTMLEQELAVSAALATTTTTTIRKTPPWLLVAVGAVVLLAAGIAIGALLSSKPNPVPELGVEVRAARPKRKTRRLPKKRPRALRRRR